MSIMLGPLIIIVLLVALFFLLVLKIILGRGEGRDPGLEREEAMLVQEIHGSLERMERRVEALETILIEKYEQGKNNS